MPKMKTKSAAKKRFRVRPGGTVKRGQAFAGNPQGPDGQKAPNVTPDPETGIGKWSIEDITTLLKDPAGLAA